MIDSTRGDKNRVIEVHCDGLEIIVRAKGNDG